MFVVNAEEGIAKAMTTTTTMAAPPPQVTRATTRTDGLKNLSTFSLLSN
jgi:hypothetical protein